MADLDDLWIPLVDEPIGSIVQQIQEEKTDIGRLIESPRRILAFRTFAYIRTGLLLGQLLFDHDLPDYDGSESWVDALLKNPEHHEALAREVRAVAEEIAADPKYADDEPLGPDDDARPRFLAFARERLKQYPPGSAGIMGEPGAYNHPSAARRDVADRPHDRRVRRLRR